MFRSLGVLLACALMASACTLVLKSGEATFRTPDAGVVDAAVASPALDTLGLCARLQAPTRLQAQQPGRSAWWGMTFAAAGDVLAVIAPFGAAPWSDVPAPMPHAGCDPRTDTPDPEIAGGGAAFAYTRTDKGWAEQRLMFAQPTSSVLSLVPASALPLVYTDGNYITWSVAASSDHIIVGLAGDPRDGMLRGSVHVFERLSAGFVEGDTPILEPQSADLNLFGNAVALLDDLLVVGAPGSGEEHGGAVYIYRIDDRNYTLLQRLTAPTPQRLAVYGQHVALTREWLAVGAPAEDIGPTGAERDAGAVYVSHWNGSEFGDPKRITDLGNMGFALALEGDTLVASAPSARGCDHAAGHAGGGLVRVYDLAPNAEPKEEACFDVDDARIAFFGYSVALHDDLLVVGAPLTSGNGRNWMPGLPAADPSDAQFPNTGTVHLYQRGPDGWSAAQSCTMKAPRPAKCDSFGITVASQGDQVLVGAELEDARVSKDPSQTILDSGALYAYPLRALP